MRSVTKVVAISLLVVALIITLMIVPIWGRDLNGREAAAQSPTTTMNTISVTGTGQASGTPDMALVQLGVEARDPDVGKAINQANQTMNAVMDALKTQGVAAEDIQTTQYNVHQEQPSEGGAEVYVVDNTVQVKVHQIDQAGPTVQAALNAGANQVYGLSFGVEDTTALEDQARQNAVDDARHCAEALAEGFGVTLGNPISISEGGGSSPVPFAAAAMAGGGGGPAISGGQFSVTVQVDVTYEIAS
jgi:uncharacterized protein YggE